LAGQTPIPGEAFVPEQWRDHGFGMPQAVRDRLSSGAFWITGAGTGFGRAVATALALVGARVVLSGRRLAKLQETADQIASLAEARIDLLPLDLTSPSALHEAADPLRRAGILGLVHCAAVPQPGSPAPLLLTDEFPRIMLTNVEATWRAARAAVSAAAGLGRVRGVLYSSEAAWHFTPGFGPYNVSKAALNSLGGSLAQEAASFHVGCDVQINVLNPGEARSEMNQGSTRSPYLAVPMTLALLGQGANGPNGCFFHADGRHLAFGAGTAWPTSLLDPPHGVASAAS
jgi:3-oxoacyl-[acyl-carrier protein] reductase